MKNPFKNLNVDIMEIVNPEMLDKVLDGIKKVDGGYRLRPDIINVVNMAYDTDYVFDEEEVYPLNMGRSICMMYLQIWGYELFLKTHKCPTAENLARIWYGGKEGYKDQRAKDYAEKIIMNLPADRK